MRDPRRIKRILARLETLWTYYPDMRFFQFIAWVESVARKDKRTPADLFYLEDYDLEILLAEKFTGKNPT